MLVAGPDTFLTWANRAEALFWIGIAVALAAAPAFRRTRRRSTGLCAACALVAFGISDLVEAKTGAWWRPWWLLMWKALCLIAPAVILARYVRNPT